MARRGRPNKHTFEDALEVLRAVGRGGVSQTDVAIQFGMSKATVSAIVSGRKFPEALEYFERANQAAPEDDNGASS